MPLEIKPIHFIDVDNFKCDRRYEVVELTEDPLFIGNEWDESPQITQRDGVFQSVHQELQENCEGFTIIDNHNEDKTSDDSDSSDMEELTVYPSLRQDLTSSTGITPVIRSIMTNNKSGIKSNSDDEEKIIAEVTVDLTQDDDTFGSNEQNSEFSDNFYHEENKSYYPRRRIDTISPHSLDTPLKNLRKNENFSSEKLERCVYNSLSGTSNRDRKFGQKESIKTLPLQRLNSEPISLNNSVTIIPLLSKCQSKRGSEDTTLTFNLQDNQNSTYKEEHEFSPLTNNSIPIDRNDVLREQDRIFINSSRLISNNYGRRSDLTSGHVSKQIDLCHSPVTMKTTPNQYLQSNQTDSNSLIYSTSHRDRSTFDGNQFINNIRDASINSTIAHQSLHEPSSFPFDNSTVRSLSAFQKRYKHSQINVCTKSCANENTKYVANPTSPVNMILPVNPFQIIIPCVHCTFKTTDFHNWFFHNKSCHKTVSVVCPFCGYRQSKKPYMQIHVCSVHLGSKPYSCHICPFTTGWKSYLKIHLLKHNDNFLNTVENV